MNITEECKKYIMSLNFGVTEECLEDYDECFRNWCEKLRNDGSIIVKDEYTDKELCDYTILVMSHIFGVSDVNPFKTISYILHEGFIMLLEDGCLVPNDEEYEQLTEADFSNVEK